MSRIIAWGFYGHIRGSRASGLEGYLQTPRQDSKGQSPEHEKMWKGVCPGLAVRIRKCSKATVVPRGQLGLDESRIEMVPEPL